jgi:ComF family protein
MAEMISRSLAWSAQLGRLALDTLLPPRCLTCEATVEGPRQLCSGCWSKLRFLSDPQCACCGTPFPFDAGPAALCAACIAEPPRFRKARAVLAYDDHSRDAVLALKHGDRTDAAPAFGAWLARAGAELMAEADAVLSVPLHRWRLFRRRYNQSALLAYGAAHAARLPVLADALQRTRNTPTQGTRSRLGRFDNVRGAFRIRPGREWRVRGKRLVLVDDVMTTGATVDACAQVLLRAGAVHVDVLTLARVVREGAS